MDVDLSLEIQGNRNPLQRCLRGYCEQLLGMAIMATYMGGQLLRTIWQLMGGNVLEASAEERRANPRRRRQQQQQQQRQPAQQLTPHQQQQPQGGEGDFLRCEEKLLGERKRSYPRLVSVVCGFPKDHAMYPKYERGKFGEDAWFQSSSPQADTLGVADGVGGWRTYGIDPGEFSLFLMRSCNRLSTYRHFDARRMDQLLSRAYLDLLEQKCPVLGSCTVCLVGLNREDSTIYTANVGDSGFLAVRSGRVLCRSLEQQHQFNTPYQLAAPPPSLNGNFLIDSPDCADCQQFVTRRGDVLLLATDGVYDNVPQDLLLDVLSSVAGVADPMRLQMAANSLALMARTLSMNQEYDSPFSQNARKMNIVAPGGKPDDITVVLASVI